MGRRAKHTKQDWIIAAFERLGEAGVDGVKVERLAKKLGTTKGSFYWHFADRPALLAEMLDFWESTGTQQIIEQLDSEQQTPAERLKTLAHLASETDILGLDAIAVEGALRAWAGQDREVAARITEVEDMRLAYLRSVLVETGRTQKQAETLAKQIYLMLLGLYSISRHNPDANHRAHFLTFVSQLVEEPLE